MEQKEIDKLILRWGELQEGAEKATKNGTYTDKDYYYELCAVVAELTKIDQPIYSLSEAYANLKDNNSR